jgi:hypothetical protein
MLGKVLYVNSRHAQNCLAFDAGSLTMHEARNFSICAATAVLLHPAGDCMFIVSSVHLLLGCETSAMC